MAMQSLLNRDVDPQRLELAFRALKTVLTEEGPLHPTQRTLLDLAQKLLLHSHVDLDALAPIALEEVVARLPDLEPRTRLVRAMLVCSLLRGEVSPRAAAGVARWAEALGVDEPSTRNLQRVAEQELLLLRFDVNRRAFTGQAVAQAREEEGALQLLRAAAARTGLLEDTRTAERYEALAGSPSGSLGHALHAYYERNHFPVPGRKHALPGFAVVHDLCHVLSGYGVDGLGEIEVVAFQSGFMKRDPLSTVFFIVLQAHLGVRLVAIAPGKSHALDDPKVLERAVRAARRGMYLQRDLFDHWDFWPDLARPIDEVRASLGVPPPDPMEA
jgi:ubiquinone biosynthesis protein Coq4